jgi:hypothetical protein
MNSSSKLTDSSTFDIKKSIDETIQEMIKTKEDDPSLFIPSSFLENYNSKEMNDFVKRTVDYCTYLFRLERSMDSKDFRLTSGVSSNDEKLAGLAARMAKSYGRLVLNVINQRKTSKDEQNFYETLIFYVAKVMQPIFDKEQIRWLEDELNRLFRSTAFNISRRNHVEDERIKRFPNLKVQKKNQDSIINNIIIRNSIPRERLRVQINESVEFKPAYVKLSAFKALSSRSPMISLILPSPSERVRLFEQ